MATGGQLKWQFHSQASVIKMVSAGGVSTSAVMISPHPKKVHGHPCHASFPRHHWRIPVILSGMSHPLLRVLTFRSSLTYWEVLVRTMKIMLQPITGKK